MIVQVETNPINKKTVKYVINDLRRFARINGLVNADMELDHLAYIIELELTARSLLFPDVETVDE